MSPAAKDFCPPEARLKPADWPGQPENRSLVAFEPDDRLTKKIFGENPKSQWIVTPTRAIERTAFFAVKVSSNGTHAQANEKL